MQIGITVELRQLKDGQGIIEGEFVGAIKVAAIASRAQEWLEPAGQGTSFMAFIFEHRRHVAEEHLPLSFVPIGGHRGALDEALVLAGEQVPLCAPLHHLD